MPAAVLIAPHRDLPFAALADRGDDNELGMLRQGCLAIRDVLAGTRLI
ncbi:hypothetical protein [Mycobacterium innocens]|nr:MULTISPECIES: hypothetical protein [Mycobacterium]